MWWLDFEHLRLHWLSSELLLCTEVTELTCVQTSAHWPFQWRHIAEGQSRLMTHGQCGPHRLGLPCTACLGADPSLGAVSGPVQGGEAGLGPQRRRQPGPKLLLSAEGTSPLSSVGLLGARKGSWAAPACVPEPPLPPCQGLAPWEGVQSRCGEGFPVCDLFVSRAARRLGL